MGTKWDEIKRSWARSFKANWALFKQSKLGLIGLSIIIFFVILAVFAPFLTPYSTSYIAPSGDLFITDNITYALPSQLKGLHWLAPISIMTPPLQDRQPYIDGVFMYAPEGKGLLYPRDFSYETTLRLEKGWPVDLPQGIKEIQYLPFNHRIIGFGERDVHLFLVTYHRDLKVIDAQKFPAEDMVISYPFKIEYHSNVWDYNFTYSGGKSILAFAVASDYNVSIWMRSYGKIGGFSQPPIISQLNITTPYRVDANPILLMDYTENYSRIIIPTEKYIYGYHIAIEYKSSAIVLKNVTLVWKYPLNGHKLVSSSAISVANPSAMHGSKITYNVVVGICNNNYGFGLYTINGTQIWNGTLSLNPTDTRIHSLEYIGLHPTGGPYLLAYGTTNIGDFVALFNEHNGQVRINKTGYYIVHGKINYISKYDPTSQSYYISTKEGGIYQLNITFTTYVAGGYVHVSGLRQSFTILGGTQTPAIYLGGIYPPPSQGSYIGAVTKTYKLYLQATSGHRIPTVVIPPFSYGRISHNFYLFGTDYEGHDIWTWLVYGSRTSLLVGLTAALISVIAGTFIGIIAGFYGGWIDIVIMRTVDIILTLPGIVIMLLLAAILGPSIWNIVLIISVLGWAGIARVIRAVTLSLKNRPFIDAARVAGASNARLMTYHLFPNVLPLTFLYMTFGVAGAILSEAALSFLGLGDPNAVSWGMMLQYLRMYGQVTNPYAWGWLLMPGIFITMISLAFYLVGRAFDEIVNPRLRKR